MRTLSGGAPRRVFFPKCWWIKFRKGEVMTQANRVTHLENELTCVQERADYLGHRVRQLSESNHTSGSSPVQRKRTKSLYEYTPRHQQRLKKQRKSMCSDALAWMEHDGYAPLRLKVLNKRTGNVEMVVMEDPESVFGPDVASETDIDMNSMLLYVKDRYDVSGSAYHKMTKICKGLPSSYKLKQRIAELNE